MAYKNSEGNKVESNYIWVPHNCLTVFPKRGASFLLCSDILKCFALRYSLPPPRRRQCELDRMHLASCSRKINLSSLQTLFFSH